MPPSNLVVVDNGAGTIKAGLLNVHGDQPRIVPNAIIRSKGDKTTYFGHELERCRDHSSLNYRLPFEKLGVPGRLGCPKSSMGRVVLE